MNIQYYRANDLIMAEYNPRQLTKDQYTQLKDSLTRFGLVDPLIVNKHKSRKNILVGGHQRLKIAKEIGMEIDPHYCDVIVKRWEEYTGNKAERVERAEC